MQTTTQHVADMIEEAGFGHFQLRVLFLACGICFCDGIEMAFGSVLAPSISKDLGFTVFQRAFLVSELCVGLMVGNAIGGYLGDIVSRRLPILLSYACVVLGATSCACVTNFCGYAMMSLLLGAGMGMGLTPSMALANETTPKASRPMLFGLRTAMFIAGCIAALSVILVDDRTLKTIHWRAALVSGVVPPLLLGIIAYFGLTESPLLLARQGRHGEAANVVRILFHQNGCTPKIDSSLDVLEAGACSDSQQMAVSGLPRSSWAEQLQIVFGPKYRFTTFILTFCMVSFNFVATGGSYAKPQVLRDTNASISPGWQLLIAQINSFLWLPLAMYAARVLSYRDSLLLSYTLAFASLMVFAWTGALEERHGLQGFLYYASQYLEPFGNSLMSIMLFYLAVDSYPPAAAATGSGFCVGGGKLGSIIAPFVFEGLPGSWTSFYYVMASMCAISMILVLAHPDLKGSAERKPLLPDLKVPAERRPPRRK